MLNSVAKFLPSNNRFERIWKLAKIDFKRRYYESYLGLFWAFLNPVFSISIYYVVFTIIFPNNIENFTFYIFIGYLFWMTFTEGTHRSFSILKSKKYLIENIQFELIDLYISATLSVVFGFIFNLLAYIFISLVAGICPTILILWLPLLIFTIALVVLGTSLILSSIQIFIKDLHMAWAIFTLAFFWATPIFYDHMILVEGAPWMRWINPMMGIIVNARDVLLYHNTPDLILMGYNLFIGILLVFLGLLFLNKLGRYAVEKM